MNNQKDIQKTGLNSYGQDNLLDINTFTNKHIYEFTNKKTEKLVTALYMVTDCMETDNALKDKLRQLGVELLSDIYKISILSPVDKYNHISSSLIHIDEILSFVEIAYTIGFVSEMNTAILKKEFLILTGTLKDNLKKDKHFTFTFNEEMFSIPPQEPTSLGNNSFFGIKDKRTLNNAMSFINNKSPLQSVQSKRTIIRTSNIVDKQGRIDKIMSLIKDKQNSLNDKSGISIKDISLAFTDCSEKTIQRELNSLVSSGQLKKNGSKRWSRYSTHI